MDDDRAEPDCRRILQGPRRWKRRESRTEIVEYRRHEAAAAIDDRTPVNGTQERVALVTRRIEWQLEQWAGPGAREPGIHSRHFRLHRRGHERQRLHSQLTEEQRGQREGYERRNPSVPALDAS